MSEPTIPVAPKSIQKGVPLKGILGADAIDCLAHNIALFHSEFDKNSFRRDARKGLEPLGLLDRGRRLANVLRLYLPEKYETAIKIILDSLTPPLATTEDNGLEVLFYLPHVSFVAEYGLEPEGNNGKDPFNISMKAQYELTKRFSAEFSMRQFLLREQQRTLDKLFQWTSDPDPHVRRLCSEGTRPRLPWAVRIPAFIENPEPVFHILETLKNDQSLYVRRSVANHLGDIAKDNLELALEICERWLVGSNNEVKWLIRHALRHPAKKKNKAALLLRAAAKAQT